MVKHIVMYSGGLGSWFCAKKLIEAVGRGSILLLFTDVGIEDADLYRFLHESAGKFDCRLEIIADGRTPWEVFRDKRYIGNTRADPCSRILKRELAKTWIGKRYSAQEVTLHFGIDWTEVHRLEAIRRYWAPYEARAILCEPPYRDKADACEALKEEGIVPPRLYLLGFPHNNCGGFCIKAGQAHFKHLLEVFPERYRYHEKKEQEMREYLGKDVAILRDRRRGETKPLTLKRLRERIERGEVGQIRESDWGGCGCFV